MAEDGINRRPADLDAPDSSRPDFGIQGGPSDAEGPGGLIDAQQPIGFPLARATLGGDLVS